MDKDIERNELINIDKNYFYKVMFILCILSIIISSLNYIGIYIKDIIEMYYLISGLVLILLVFSIKKIYRCKFYKYIAVIFIINCSTNIYRIMIEDIWSLNNSIFVVSTLRLTLILLGIDMIIKYINKKDSKLISLFKIVVFIVYIIFLSITNFTEFFLLSNIVYAIKIKIEVSKAKKDKYSINYVDVYLMIAIFRNIIIILGLIYINNEIIIYLINYTVLLTESILIFCFIYKIINLPYGKIENELKEALESINYLNEDLKLTNEKILLKRNIINDIEKTFKSLFRNIPVPTLIINLNKNNIVYANRQSLELFGEEKFLDLVGVNFYDLIEVIDEEDLNNLDYRGVIGVIKKNNKKITIETKDKSEEQGEAIIMLTDMTSKTDYLNIENLIMEKKLQENIKRNFLSNISHDLKTPINVIYSSAQVQNIYIENRNSNEIEKHINISKQNYLVLKRLTNNIIDVGKIDSGALKCNLKKGNIVYFIEDICSSFVDYAREENIKLIFDTDEEEVYIKFDNNFMERIVINLISNAIKYNKDVGEIFVFIKSENEFVDISIRDTGIGIQKEFLDKIFERYSKDKKTKKAILKSSGIGMYVVKNLIEAQNGEIFIYSEEGLGTEIVMRFIREN